MAPTPSFQRGEEPRRAVTPRPAADPHAGARRRGRAWDAAVRVGGPAGGATDPGAASAVRSRSSGPRTRRSAISPPTSRCSSRGRCAGRRWTSPRRSRARSARRPTASLIASAEVARPGFVNLRVADSAFESTVAGILAAPALVGPRSSRDHAARRRRRVRVRQPDRTAAHRQRAGRLRRRPAQPRARGGRPAGDARVLLQRLRRPGAQARRLGARDPERRAGAGGRLPRRVRGRPRGGECPPTSRPPRPAPGADGADVLGRWASERVRAGIEASLERLGVHFDVWKWRARCTARAGSIARSSACGTAGTYTSRTARCGSGRPTFGDDKDRVLIRSTAEPDLLRGRHRLRGREARPRLRPPHLHLGRRPPRLRSPGRAARPRRWATIPRGGRGAAHRLGPVRSCAADRSRDVEAGRRLYRSTTLLDEVGNDAARWFFASRGRSSTSRSTSSWPAAAVGREPGLLRPVRPRPDRLDPAQGRRRRPVPSARRRGLLAGEPEAAARPDRRAVPGGRRGRRRRPGDAGHHRLCDRARDPVPRLLSRRARRRRRSSRSVRRSGSRWRSRR